MIRLCIVTALPCEARPWVERYRLAPVRRTPLPVYRGDDTALVVSGIGSTACAVATGYLAGLTGAGATSVWLNAGIAGHPTLPRGEVAVVCKSIHRSRPGAHYPSLPVGTNLALAGCTTVDDVEHAFEEDTLFDMECSGFFAAAPRFAPVDLVHSVKVVSDNPVQPASELDRDTISQLVASRLPRIAEGFVDPLLSLAGELAVEYEAADLSAFLDHWHFSVANENRLRALVADWQALNDGAVPEADGFRDCRSASEVLARMRGRIDTHEPVR